MKNISSKEELESIINENHFVLAYFSSETCGVCLDLRPKVELLLEKYPEIEGIYVNVEKSTALARANNIFTIPGILVFIEGKETIREARHISIHALDRKLNRYYGLLFE